MNGKSDDQDSSFDRSVFNKEGGKEETRDSYRERDMLGRETVTIIAPPLSSIFDDL